MSSSTVIENNKNASSSSSNNASPPRVVNDPRFVAARKMVGHEGAVDMFATLVEETIAKHGDVGLEAAAVFYEYGNALFRRAVAGEEGDDTEEVQDAAASQEPQKVKEAAAAAAEARFAAQKERLSEDHQPPNKEENTLKEEDGQDDSKPAAAAAAPARIEDDDDDHPTTIVTSSTEPPDSHVDDDDIHLALEMMENAYSILEEHLHPDENEWIQRQLPRILQGLGDVLRELNRMSDAADAYSRALPYREEFVAAAASQQHDDENNNQLSFLKDRRLLVEANVLVAEALLGCAHGRHVVTSETKDMLVTADERVDYARGYYDKARDELQETVLLMGRIAAATNDNEDEFQEEKQNVCFAATLLMGVGETLAAFDEEQQASSSNAEGKPPAAKKLRTEK